MKPCSAQFVCFVFFLFIYLFIFFFLWIWHYVHGMWHRLLGMLYKQWHRKLSQDMYTNINAKYLLPLEVYYSVYCTDFRVAYIYLHIMHLLQVKSEWSPRAMKLIFQIQLFYSRFQGRLHGKHCSYSKTLQLLMLIIDTKAL